MGSALDRVRTAQAENEAATVIAKETTAALKDTTAAAQEVTGRLKWLEIHIKREQAQQLKRFRRELIVCAVVAFAVSITTLVLGNILREIAIETIDNLRVWWAG